MSEFAASMEPKLLRSERKIKLASVVRKAGREAEAC